MECSPSKGFVTQQQSSFCQFYPHTLSFVISKILTYIYLKKEIHTFASESVCTYNKVTKHQLRFKTSKSMNKTPRKPKRGVTDWLPSLGTNTRFLPLSQYTAASKALQVKNQDISMRDICFTILTDSELPLLFLPAKKLARASELPPHKNHNQEIYLVTVVQGKRLLTLKINLAIVSSFWFSLTKAQPSCFTFQ